MFFSGDTRGRVGAYFVAIEPVPELGPGQKYVTAGSLPPNVVRGTTQAAVRWDAPGDCTPRYRSGTIRLVPPGNSDSGDQSFIKTVESAVSSLGALISAIVACLRTAPGVFSFSELQDASREASSFT